VRYLVLGDLHANLQALDAVLADAADTAYDAVLVLGDLVGYGADPGPVIDRTLALEPVAIVRGNHDKVCAGLEPASLFNDVARRSIEWTAEVLSPGQLAVLASLPKGPAIVSDTIEICHGSPFDEDQYLFDAADAAQAIDATTRRFCLFGHTHLPAVFATREDPVKPADQPPDGRWILPARGPALVNVGSVGQPRDGDPRAAYGVLDTTANVLSLHRVTYDVAGAQQRILDEGLPPWLALRLERGQ
jgi:diadenosine tetraphosphatase ApaH/serine/threonine PP2A family protein phosphatase